MGWRVYGDKFENLSSEFLLGREHEQQTTFNKNIILRTVRCWAIFVGDPTFDSLRLNVRPDNDGVQATTLIAQSTNTLTKAEVLTDNSGVREIFFNFNDISLSEGGQYWVALSAVGYSPSSSSFIAMRRQWPDPYYDGVTTTFVSQARNPFSFYFIGSEI